MILFVYVVSFCAECIQDTFMCVKNGEDKCLPIKWICDGATDCDNGQDELNCGVLKPPFILLFITLLMKAQFKHRKA